MTYSILKNTRNLLINDSTLTNHVPATNIRVGYPGELTSLPTIIITTVSSTDVGSLGYATAPEGSKDHKVDVILQFDVLTRTSMKEAIEITDRITEVLMNNGRYSKTSENDFWNDTYKAYHRILRCRYFEIATR